MDEHIDPHYLVDHLADQPYLNTHLLSVTDLQSNTRVVGYLHRRPNISKQKSFWRGMGQELVRQLTTSR